MNFNMAEIEALRLAGCYKSLPQELDSFQSELLSSAGIRSLCTLRLLRIDKQRNIRLTPAGWDLLSLLGHNYPRDKGYLSDPAKLRRRKEAALLMFTFYRAGIPVFAQSVAELPHSPIFLSAAAARRNTAISTANVWAGCRLAGIARVGEATFLLHYVDEKGIQFTSEMELFQKLTANHCARTACIYAAASYREAIGWIQSTAPPLDNKRGGWVSFRDACKRTVLPVHLLECSNTGAVQLAVMNTPGYRERIAHLVTVSCYQPPPPTLPDADAILEGLPLVTAVDMDVKRIGCAYREARKLGFATIRVVALTEQLDALSELLHPLGVTELYDIAQADLMRAMQLAFYEPSSEPYRTKEGGVLSVSDIPFRRKAGRPPKQAP